MWLFFLFGFLYFSGIRQGSQFRICTKRTCLMMRLDFVLITPLQVEFLYFRGIWQGLWFRICTKWSSGMMRVDYVLIIWTPLQVQQLAHLEGSMLLLYLRGKRNFILTSLTHAFCKNSDLNFKYSLHNSQLLNG